MNDSGELIYRDNDSGMGELFYEGQPGDYFVLEQDGRFVAKDFKNEIKWFLVNKYRMALR